MVKRKVPTDKASSIQNHATCYNWGGLGPPLGNSGSPLGIRGKGEPPATQWLQNLKSKIGRALANSFVKNKAVNHSGDRFKKLRYLYNDVL